MTKLRLPISLQQAVMFRLRLDLAQANQRLNTNYPEPKVSYQQKGTSAGSAYATRWEIRLNAALLLENGQPFIDEVVPHELAHLIAHRHFGKVAPHGKEWRYVMEQILDISAQRTHRFDVSTVQGKTFLYHCSCQKHHLTLRRHNRITRGEAEYRCQRCHDRLILINNFHDRINN